MQSPLDLAALVEARTFDVEMDFLLGPSQLGCDSDAGPTIYAGDHQVPAGWHSGWRSTLSAQCWHMPHLGRLFSRDSYIHQNSIQ